MDCVDYEYLTASRLISNRECLLYGFIATASAANKYLIIYDGDSDAEDIAFKVTVGQYKPVVALFPTPVKMQKGLYAKLEGNLDQVTILWQPLKV